MQRCLDAVDGDGAVLFALCLCVYVCLGITQCNVIDKKKQQTTANKNIEKKEMSMSELREKEMKIKRRRKERKNANGT